MTKHVRKYKYFKLNILLKTRITSQSQKITLARRQPTTQGAFTVTDSMSVCARPKSNRDGFVRQDTGEEPQGNGMNRCFEPHLTRRS